MKRFFSILAILILLIPFGYADLTIQILQGVNKPYPIAVIPFSHDVTIPGILPSGLAGVIGDDLNNSGRFADLPTNQMPALPSNVAAFNWGQWSTANTGVEYAVLGNIEPGVTPDTYNVSFALLSLISNQPMMGQRFMNVPRSKLRLLAHQISDTIYQTITGKKGYFRTRLAYVTVFNPSSAHAIWQLVVSDYDGFNPHALLTQKNNPIASPNWSSDGTELAYVSYVKNRQAIFTINLATGIRKIIANFPGINSAPNWSPNDKFMAMSLSGSDTSAQADLFVMNLQTQQLIRYTNYGDNTSPAWSPDGKMLAFNSDQGGSPQIYVYNFTTKQINRVSYNGANNYAPIFTPDGKNLIIMSQQHAGGPIRLATLNLATNAMNIITTGQLDKSPSISPNGDMIVYANYDSPRGILAETSLDGTVQLKLPATSGNVQSPAWSPFLN